MIAKLQLGQRVRLWPRPGLRVPEHSGIGGRFLPAGGADVEWSTWWARRVGDGSVLLTEPGAKPQPTDQPSSAPAEEGTSP